jgi:hypothetical protein
MNAMPLDDALRAGLIDVARRLADSRGWPWIEPITVTAVAHRGEAAWEVRSNALALGRNVRVVLRRSDSTVLEAGYLPR